MPGKRGKPFQKQDDGQQRLKQTTLRFPAPEPWTLPQVLRLRKSTSETQSQPSSLVQDTVRLTGNAWEPIESTQDSLLAASSEGASSSVAHATHDVLTSKERLQEQKTKMARLQETSKNRIEDSTVVKKAMEIATAQGVIPYSLQTLEGANTARNRWQLFQEARSLDPLTVPTQSIMFDFVESTLTTNIKTSDPTRLQVPLTCLTVHTYLWALRKIVFPKLYPSAFSATDGWEKDKRDEFWDSVNEHLIAFTTEGAIKQTAMGADQQDAQTVSDTMHMFTQKRTAREHAFLPELELFQQLLFCDPLQSALCLQLDVYIAIAEQVSLRTSSVVQTDKHLLDDTSLYHDKAPITLRMVKFSKGSFGKNGEGRQLSCGDFARLTCTITQDANKGHMTEKLNFDHTLTVNHQSLARSSPHRVLRGCAFRGIFAASHANGGDYTKQLVTDAKKFRGLFMKDNTDAMKRAMRQARTELWHRGQTMLQDSESLRNSMASYISWPAMSEPDAVAFGLDRPDLSREVAYLHKQDVRFQEAVMEHKAIHLVCDPGHKNQWFARCLLCKNMAPWMSSRYPCQNCGSDDVMFVPKKPHMSGQRNHRDEKINEELYDSWRSLGGDEYSGPKNWMA